VPHSQEIEDLLADPNPLWLWDGIAGRIYWANDAGLEFWQAEHLDDIQAMQFDHAMPALRRLRKLSLSELPDRGRDEKLMFWTRTGNKHVICNCVKIHVDGYGELLLMRLRGEEKDKVRSIKADAKSATDQSAVEHKPATAPDKTSEHGAAGKLLDGDDVAATLREIARQVRAESKFSEPQINNPKQPSDKSDQRDERGHHEQHTNDEIPPKTEPGIQAPKTNDGSIEDVEFFAKISHEVRTPLNSILGFSELMMQERFGAVENAKYAEYIIDIHESAVLALSLINDVLDLSRMVAGQFDVSAEEIGINDLSRSMMRIMRPQAEKRSIRLKTELASHEILINAGHRSMKQVLLNLLTNAIKFTGQGGSVTIKTGLENSKTAYVKICDTGSGMTKIEVDTVMRPFSQLKRNAEHVEGTGLGLPITKALVDANGGQFVIKSTPDIGTEVKVLFPVQNKIG